MHTIRTSLAFPTPFYQRLVSISQKRKLPVSETVRLLLEPMLENEEAKRRQKSYAAFRRVKGICVDPITDASVTIDEVLYGDMPTKDHQ